MMSLISLTELLYYNNLNIYTYTEFYLNLIYLGKSIIEVFVNFYILTKNKIKLIFITNIKYIQLYIKYIGNLTYNPYYIRNWVLGNFNNWVSLKQLLLLYKWVLILFNLISINKLVINLKLYIKLYKLFKYLNNLYKGFYYLTCKPNYIFILNFNITYLMLKELISNKLKFICIHNNYNVIKHATISIISTPNFLLMLLLLELYNINWLYNYYNNFKLTKFIL